MFACLLDISFEGFVWGGVLWFQLLLAFALGVTVWSLLFFRATEFGYWMPGIVLFLDFALCFGELLLWLVFWLLVFGLWFARFGVCFFFGLLLSLIVGIGVDII